MAITLDTCRAEALMLSGANQLVFPLALGTTIQFQIGATPITGLVDISGANNENDINTNIGLDPTYLNSGTTIVLYIIGDSIVAFIEKSSTSQIGDTASFSIIYPPLPLVDFDGSGLFICSIVGTCQTEVITNVNFQLGDPPGTIQYFVGITAITSAIAITNASTIVSIQTDIDNDPTYQSSGYTILITNGLPQLTAIITTTSSTQITSDASGVFLGTNPDTGTGTFICNLPQQSTKKRKRGGVYPNICCNPENYPDKKCPQHLNIRGNIYQKIEGTNCYRLTRRSR